MSACVRPSTLPTSNAARSSNQDVMNGCRMQFFFYEVVARIVAIYLGVDCIRKLQSGLVERKITSFFHCTDILDLVFDGLLGWPSQVFHRDTAPVRYWMEMGHQAVAFLACLVVAIFGWWHPSA
jgi:hypothetical protein